ncbi:hypothetical protein [Litchfieldia alkalitelluris]|uniref:hypothetical protein n=1 Tax=Litchfieldia alkalitelluris TaxID=304268 RepID=UPI000995FE26|nr:hypothetical protein [Litchfieldia alkalitelluris]
MIQSKQDYLSLLAKELNNHPDSTELLHEIDIHITEMVEDLYLVEGLNEAEAMIEVQSRLGTPTEIALNYQKGLVVTPSKTQWTFISVNILFFIGGIFLTFLYHVIPLPIVSETWSFLTSIPTVIILLYMCFWALLGYEIGKEFGYGGKKLLAKTFYISLVPNLLLMVLVVFQVVPRSWFHPLLTPSFIIACILCTIVLYPISYASFKWGTFKSV